MRLLAAAGAILLAGLCLFGRPPLAEDGLVEKRTFTLPSYTTVGGQTIRDVKVGWEAYGTLNAAKDNVILVTHFFSGNSHAAGRYKADDKLPGYWDAIIGPGKPLDTDRFYVIASDTLVNLGAKDPTVVTTGPASLDPATGKPYGLNFPIVTIRDFVEVQRALLESQGITRLYAVMGASMGALQAYEWAAVYPDRVQRLIPVVGAGWADAGLIAWLNVWASPIRLDPNWKGGDYYEGTPPDAGLAAALKVVTLQAQHWEWADETFGRAWAVEGKDPAASLDNLYKVEAVLDAAGAARAKISDANHFLYLVKANQLFYAGHGEGLFQGLAAIAAPTLVIYSDEDQVFPAEAVRATAAVISADGTPVRLVELQGTRGHLDGVVSIAQASDAIRAFLAQ